MFTRIRSAIRGALTPKPARSTVVDVLHDWQIMTAGGGTKITVRGLTREQALEQAGKIGTLMYVDDDHYFIFVKPPGFVPSLPQGL